MCFQDPVTKNWWLSLQKKSINWLFSSSIVLEHEISRYSRVGWDLEIIVEINL